jgi:hypothetical protein
MSKFILTAKVNMPLNGGMRIDKGQTFEVNLPFGQLPFTSIDNKARVNQILNLQGFDLKGHESYLSGSYFDFKKI